MLKRVPGGYHLSIHGSAAARQNRIGGCHDDALRVSVTAVAEKGKANLAIRKLLANTLDLKVSQLQLIAGESHRRKQFMIIDEDTGLPGRVAELGAIG